VSDLGEVIGAILAGIAHARRVSDEETAAIAEYYREHELLSGLSAPRLRLPSVKLDLPVIVDEHQLGDEDEAEIPSKVSRLVIKDLAAAAKKSRVSLPRGFSKTLREELEAAYAQLPRKGRGLRTRFGRTTAEVFKIVVEDKAFGPHLPRNFQSLAAKRLAAHSRLVALKRTPRPPNLQVTVLTEKIRQESDPANVARLSIELREEGLEWSILEDDDGQETSRLLPE